MAVTSSSSGGGSFAKKYASKSKNNLSQLIQKKQDNKMTTSQALETKNSFNTQSSSISPDKAGKVDLIYLVKGVDDNRNAWYYVLVERLKLSLFLKDLNDDIIHLENYGEILYSAYGDEPSQEITDKLKAEYGIK
jgi:hypothetical protein